VSASQAQTQRGGGRAAGGGDRPGRSGGGDADRGARPQAGPTRTDDTRGDARPPKVSQRKVRLSVSRVDPWSALKLSFLLSVVVGIALVVTTAVLWTVLDGIGLYDSVNSMIAQLSGTGDVDVTDFVGFTQVVSAATVVAVVDVVLLTALATLGAVVYNISAALVGGLRVTLTDD
jgi:hypothetical protein